MIRRALPHDVRAIIGLGEEARKEMPWFPEINHKRIYDMAANWFLLPEHCCALVAEENHKIVGMLISTVAENLWSGSRYVLCFTCYTLPSYRNKAPYLLKKWIEWAKYINAESAWITPEGERDNPKLQKLLTLLGFKEKGTRFIIEF